MNEGLIPNRYAKALLKVAQEKNLEKNLYDIMQTLTHSFADNPSLQKTVANPFVDAAKKSGILLSAAGVTKENAPLFADFITLMIRNKRIEAMRETALAYQILYRKTYKIYLVNISSAAPLSQQETDRLKNLILAQLPQNASIQLTQSVDPSLIGGFVISLDNEQLDASVKNQLKQLRSTLSSQ